MLHFFCARRLQLMHANSMVSSALETLLSVIQPVMQGAGYACNLQHTGATAHPSKLIYCGMTQSSMRSHSQSPDCSSRPNL